MKNKALFSDHFFLRLFFIGACLAALTACSTTKNDSRYSQEIEALSVQSAQLEEKRSASDAQKKQLAEQQEAMITKEEELLKQAEAPSALVVQTGQAQSSDMLPPDAKPGECYARIFIPTTYEYKSEQVIDQGPKESLKLFPAKYETVEQHVLVKPESKKLITILAKYKWVEKRVLLVGEKKKLIQVPAVYKTISKKVLVKEAHIEWKKGVGPIQKLDDTTGEIMCLVEMPAVYKTVDQKIMKTPPSTKEVITPAVYNKVKKQVMVSPPTVKEIIIPAEYKFIEVTRMVSPPRSERITIPAVYKTVKRKVVVEPGHLEWQQILCETNITQERILQMQWALLSAGYNPGSIDGVVGALTMKAVNKYQTAKGLPVTKYLTFETITSLGLLW